MKVYIVTLYYHYENESIIGVYSSYEVALSKILKEISGTDFRPEGSLWVSKRSAATYEIYEKDVLNEV